MPRRKQEGEGIGGGRKKDKRKKGTGEAWTTRRLSTSEVIHLHLLTLAGLLSCSATHLSQWLFPETAFVLSRGLASFWPTDDRLGSALLARQLA